ncbi:carboxylating nicotinate-nucleotide diphosphorylase [Cohnella thailandensis]|uniref:Probable nicotinate-nucleotide pyrophosphorylase [carboxylating] n=1 Tax=Cohnella thailandensis TaxID=557557 RepID=A0A841T6K3_9BACL|nr:carboxylating nicotinate-nucleotide diphosphorylase [Cohnella thailandensis]MBB6637928.1 carboxylating nicotinate-nucleotide diphosphorylase [Cohnella thailandensis]MBP1977734.1 nicotinate-nucleotide pyrophosphorylase (carboxylating) [Cohnella thailandensis]
MFERESDWRIGGPAKEAVRGQIRAWLAEDIGGGDVTTMATVPEGQQSKAIIHAKASGVIAGIPVARMVFEVVDPSLVFEAKVSDGDQVEKGKVLAIVEGSSHSILTGERLALNLLQRMSGIATVTRVYADAAEGFPARIADTRKTTPGHRTLEKYAVRIGGGYNHRFGLYDAVMIKDNHIKAAGGIPEAVAAAKARVPHTMKIEVEAESLEQALEAARAGADIIMFDNMSPAAMKEAAVQVRGIASRVILEASGGVRPERVREIAASGVDVISVGGLTHSFQALDISLDLNEKKGASL